MLPRCVRQSNPRTTYHATTYHSFAAGQLPEEYMRDIDIVRYDRAGNETRRWTLHGAWVKVLEYDDMEGGNTDNSIEKLTICYQYWRA